jgi:hypothetical protein
VFILGIFDKDQACLYHLSSIFPPSLPRKRTIGNLPAALPRIEKIIGPASLICPCGCGVMRKIGEDRTERLDIVLHSCA